METLIAIAALAVLIVFFYSIIGLIFTKIYKKKFGHTNSIRRSILLYRTLPAFFVFFVLLGVISGGTGSGDDAQQASNKAELATKPAQSPAQKTVSDIEKLLKKDLISVQTHGWAATRPDGQGLTVDFKANKSGFMTQRSTESTISEIIITIYCKNDPNLFDNIFLKASLDLVDSHGSKTPAVIYRANFSGEDGRRLNCKNVDNSHGKLEVIPNLLTSKFIHPAIK